MTILDRRSFVRLSAGALFASYSSRLQAQSDPPEISNQEESVHVTGANYSWEYSQKDDQFQLFDAKKRLIVAGVLQPAILVSVAGDATAKQCIPGKLARHNSADGRVTFEYEGVNGAGRLSVAWRFDKHGIWTEPVVYETSSAEDVVSLHYFTDVKGNTRVPSLQASFLVVPGISEGSSISPILGSDVRLNETVWLGRGSPVPGLLQQWGLPVHYFGGFSVKGEHARNSYIDQKSDSFICGLADLPNGDLFLDLHEGRSSMWLDYRSDIWKHMRGPGRLTLGATLFWTVGGDYYDAIGKYYGGLVNSGIVKKKQNSPRKTAIALTPQFCTWGAQVARGKASEHLDEAFLSEIYKELRASGMKAGMFSIDDKWEGSYGKLEHSAERLPHFEQFLNQVRADGNRIGLWAALMRCEKPSEIGLTEDHMLKKADGTPVVSGGETKYFILDFTQPEVAKVLSELARKFIRRYKPDLVKFDFGYELPAVSQAAPKDKHWAGERMMWKGLDVVITAMREENPDLVVMYYQLSPLFLEYFDLHSPDDLFLNSGEYDIEANRRFFFSSLLGELGVPTYGSSGYDWQTAPNIWFDSSVVGTLGSLNDFGGDERGEKSSPQLIAKYNGLTQALRSSNFFKVVPLDGVTEAQTRSAHSHSWARLEDDKVVLLAIRPDMPHIDSVPIMDRAAISRLRGMVRAPVPVVVASRTKEDIAHTGRLAVVPYGDGQISIHTEKGHKADVFTHHFGGAVTQAHIAIANGRLNLPVAQRGVKNDLIEWIDVHVS
ncbi:MAG TPA: hypothetical protein VN737_00115 [Bryobacteraceae bacterium]|nr:hypothetical protein [Bryobacteraceae bacterium]